MNKKRFSEANQSGQLEQGDNLGRSPAAPIISEPLSASQSVRPERRQGGLATETMKEELMDTTPKMQTSPRRVYIFWQ